MKTINIMNKNLINLAKFVFLITIIIACISCNSKKTEKDEYTENIVLDVKADAFEYKVYENHAKVNSDNIDQCEKFFEFKSNAEGFEIYGADIADLYATFSKISRNNVDLKNKKAVFYTVIYKGKQSDSVKNEILNYLLDKRNLQVIEHFLEVNSLNITVGNSDKIAKYISKDGSKENSTTVMTDDNYELTNTNLKTLAVVLNDLYPNTFFYKGNEERKYDFKIPLGRDVNAIIDYLKETYGIESSPSVENITSYEIINK